MTKVAVLVLAADGNYRPLVDAIRETWGIRSNDRFKVIYYYGIREGFPAPEPGRTAMAGDVMICGCKESIGTVLTKTLMAYERALSDLEFDYTFRCCCGSYVDPDVLMTFLEDKPKSGFYCGIMGGRPPGFASGSGYFLSRDLVERVVSEKDKILSYGYPGRMDDVAIGKFMGEIGVRIDRRARRQNRPSEASAGTYHYHFGLKGGAERMREIHREIASRR